MKKDKQAQSTSTASLNTVLLSRREAIMGALSSLGIVGTSLLVTKATLASPLSEASSGKDILEQLVSPSQSLHFVEENNKLVSRNNGFPDHPTGQFPNENCPGAITAQTRTIKIPKAPQIASKLTPLDGWLMGVAVNGVVFDPTGPFYKGLESTGYQFEVISKLAMPYLGIDFNNAHVQPSGEYHYHAMPHSLISKLMELRAKRHAPHSMLLLGFAADGFPIYGPVAHKNPYNLESALITLRSSYRLKSGRRPVGSPGGTIDGSFVQDFEFIKDLGELDECNGRSGITPEYPNGTYYYVITHDFPYIPRFWKGTPDPSFAHPKPGVDAVPAALMNFDFSKT